MEKLHYKEKYSRSQVIGGYLLIMPALLLFAVFFPYCIIQAIRYSFMDWNGIGKQVFVGLSNYIELFKDPVFWKAFINNWYYTAGIIAFGVLPGMVLAYLLSTPGLKGRGIFRSIYFLPRIISAVVYGTVWVWILDPRKGLFRMFLDFFGVKGIAVLGNVNTAMLGICVIGGWTYFGFCMVIFLAAFMGVDSSINESAIIDGASAWQIFWRITLPQIRPVINMMIVYTVIDSFKVYDLVLVLTSGGPNNATQIMTYYIYKQGFEMNRYGYGSAAALVLGAFMVVFTVIYNRMNGEEGDAH